MHLSRIVIRNFRNFASLDVRLRDGVTCVIGENNTGKTNLLHALRLAIDTNLSSSYRTLRPHDIHAGEDFETPNQVLVAVEFVGYKDSINDTALFGSCEVEEDLSRIHYRFRPRREVREEIENGERDPKGLSLSEDYHFELTGGGAADPATVAWDEDLGRALRFGDLQAFHIEYLPALRDVKSSLRNSFESPLGRVLGVSEFDDDEKEALVSILREANTAIEAQPTIEAAGTAIRNSFSSTSGEAHEMGLKLGMSEPSFASISRSLKILLSNSAINDFEPGRNGLGLNNILYISMILEYFERRAKAARASGQLLLLEEPEAHLHPQLQRVLYGSLADKPFQAILTTHSTHVSSHAPLESYITLTNDGRSSSSGCALKEAAGLSESETADLNRFLEATRSILLYARKVILVEGPSELFLIPALVKSVMNIDLDRYGISIVPIFGTHFKTYAKLFASNVLRKKCAIITDGDLVIEDCPEGTLEDDAIDVDDEEYGKNETLQVYKCPVTFERAMTVKGTLSMFLEALRECDYPQAVNAFEQGIDKLKRKTEKEMVQKTLAPLREKTLASAKRCGKSRFAQIASKYADQASALPTYIREAIEWIMEDE
jgi:putative ATP-dependent endonuclease of OLD family